MLLLLLLAMIVDNLAAMIANENLHDLPTVENENFQPHEGWIVHLSLRQKTITTVGVEEATVGCRVITRHAIEVDLRNTHPLRLQGLGGLLEVAKMSFEEPMIGVAMSKDCLPLLILRHHHHRMRDILTIGEDVQGMVALIVEDTIPTKKRWKIWNDVFQC